MKKVLCFILLFYVAKTFAQIDVSFANKGFAEFNIGYASAEIYSLDIDVDGKIITASRSEWFPHPYGEIIVSRFHPDGSEDSTFALFGHLRIPKVNIVSYPPTIKADHQNRYIVATTSSNNSNLIVFCIANDGKIDKSFGNNGMFSINLPAVENSGSPVVKDLHIYPDNSIGIAFHSRAESIWPPVDIHAVGMVRLKENGQLEESFGDNGIVHHLLKNTINYNDFFFTADEGACFDNSGNAYLFKRKDIDSLSFRTIVKILPDGTLDESFGDGGEVLIPNSNEYILNIGFHQMDIDPSGAIYLKDYYKIMKLLPEGKIDSSWAENGILTLDEKENLTPLLTEDELILLGHKEIQFATKYQSIVRWYDQNGQLTAKGTDDENLENLELLLFAGKINQDGNLLLGGYRSSNGDYTHRMSLTQVKATGHIDTSFGEEGTRLYFPIGNSTSINGYVVFDDGSVIVSGRAYNGTYYDGFIAKHHPNGQLDSTFGQNGRVYQPFDTDRYEYTVLEKLDNESFLAIISHKEVEIKYNSIYRIFNSDGNIDHSWVNGAGKIEIFHNENTYLRMTDDQNFRLSYLDTITKKYTIQEYLPSGLINTSFGNNGFLTLYIPNISNYVIEDVKYLDGRIYVQIQNQSNSERTINLYGLDGYLRNDFGENGKIQLGKNPYSFYFGKEKEIFVLQNLESYVNISLKKYTSDGKKMNEFGLNGQYANVDYLQFQYNSFVNDLYVLNDNSLLLLFEAYGENTFSHLNFMRIKADGTPDLSFGYDGLISVPIAYFYFTSPSTFIDPISKDIKIIGIRNIRSDEHYFMSKLSKMNIPLTGKQNSSDNNYPLTIYPNPGKSLIHISLENKSVHHIQLLNINGQVLKEWNSRMTEINGSQIYLNIPEKLPIGTYLFRVSDGENFYFGKWMKK